MEFPRVRMKIKWCVYIQICFVIVVHVNMCVWNWAQIMYLVIWPSFDVLLLKQCIYKIINNKPWLITLNSNIAFIAAQAYSNTSDARAAPHSSRVPFTNRNHLKLWHVSHYIHTLYGCDFSSMPNFNDSLIKPQLQSGSGWVITFHSSCGCSYLSMP